ncbi:MAG: hypothetical protein VSS75_008665, partial [Candidatus Parabeggiatoa sp.]|nr:hypothetical protein [Candidatus Parabeggiatoa sp.]
NIAMRQASEVVYAGSQEIDKMAGMADELGTLANNLREEAARFKLREQTEEGMAIPAGITPQMLEQIAKIIGEASITRPNNEETPFDKKEQPNVLPLSWDKKGFEHF